MKGTHQPRAVTPPKEKSRNCPPQNLKGTAMPEIQLTSIGLLRVAAFLEEVFEPCLSFGVTELAMSSDSGFQCLLHTWRSDSRATHVEEPALAQQILRDELRLIRHFVRDKNHLGRVVRPVELEGANEFCQH